MAANKVPLIDMTTDDKGAFYIAALERKITALTLNELKYRAFLEMMTGEKWEEIGTDITAGDMKRLAVTATQRRLARSMQEAEEIVERNIAMANEDSLPESNL